MRDVCGGLVGRLVRRVGGSVQDGGDVAACDASFVSVMDDDGAAEDGEWLRPESQEFIGETKGIDTSVGGAIQLPVLP